MNEYDELKQQRREIEKKSNPIVLLTEKTFTFLSENEKVIIGCDISLVHRKLPFKVQIDIYDCAIIPSPIYDCHRLPTGRYETNCVVEGEEVLLYSHPLTVSIIEDVFRWLELYIANSAIRGAYTLKVVIDYKQERFCICLVTF